MTRITLEEKQILDSSGKLIGVQRVEVEKKTIDELLSIDPLNEKLNIHEAEKHVRNIPETKALKIEKLKKFGYTDEHISRLEAEDAL